MCLNAIVIMCLQLKCIDHIHIRAAEADLTVAGCGRCATIAEDIDVWKSNVHRHGTELTTLCIIIEGISDFMTTVILILGLLISSPPKCDSCNVRFFVVQYSHGGVVYERYYP